MTPCGLRFSTFDELQNRGCTFVRRPDGGINLKFIGFAFMHAVKLRPRQTGLAVPARTFPLLKNRGRAAHADKINAL